MIARIPGRAQAASHIRTIDDDLRTALDEGWDEALVQGQEMMDIPAEYRWLSAGLGAGAARIFARLGYPDPALQFLSMVLPAIERGAGWAGGYTRVIFDAATTLWLLERTEHLDVTERNLREKVIPPDFRFPMTDARLALARLCALSGRCDEAAEWFAKARCVLDEQGARLLRAIVDHDEALMYARRAAPGGSRARSASARGGAGSVPRHPYARVDREGGAVAGRRSAAGGSFRYRARRGAHEAVAHVRSVSRPGRFLDHCARRFDHTPQARARAALPGAAVVAGAGSNGGAPSSSPVASRSSLGDAGELLDAEARAAYKQRVADLREDLDEAEQFE